MDTSSILRLISLFGSPQQVQQNNSAQVLNPTPFTGAGMPTGQMSQPPQVDPYDPLARMKQLYQPRTDISQRYSAALGQMPQRQPISIPRGLAAIASSALIGSHNPQLGLEAGDMVANGPYNKQMTDWENQTKALGIGANEEDRYNTNQRLLANETIQREEQDRKQDEVNRAAGVKEKQNQEKIDNANARTEVYRQKMEISKDLARGGKPIPGKDGNYKMVYRDGSTKDIDMKGWTPADIAEMKNEFALQQIDERGKVESDNIQQRGNISFGLQDKRDTAAMARKQVVTPPKPVADKQSTVEVRDSAGKLIGTRQTNTTNNAAQILRSKATDFLKANGLPVTEANIKHAIDTGRVK